MHCPYCGSITSDAARFCPACGANIGAELNAVPEANTLPRGQVAPPEPSWQQQPEQDWMPQPEPDPYRMPHEDSPSANAPVTVAPQTGMPPVNQPVANVEPSAAHKPRLRSLHNEGLARAASEGLGMKFYSFLATPGLFLSAALYVISGIINLITAFVLTTIPAAESTTMLAFMLDGTLLIILGGLRVYERFLLWRFSRKALLFYTIIAISSIVLGLCFCVFTMILIGKLDIPCVIREAGLGIAALIIIFAYFGKRRHLFVN